MFYPLHKAHLLKLWAGVGQALQSMGQVIVCCKVQAVCMDYIVDHREKGFVVLHLKQETDPMTTSEKRDKKKSGFRGTVEQNAIKLDTN